MCEELKKEKIFSDFLTQKHGNIIQALHFVFRPNGKTHGWPLLADKRIRCQSAVEIINKNI